MNLTGIHHPGTRRPAFVLSLAFAALLMSSRDAETQWTFQVGDPPSTGTPDAVFTVPVPTVCSDGSGIVPAGGYVKVNTNLTLDTMVTNGGTCRNYLYGTYNSTSPHGVVKIFEYEYVPDYPYPLGPVTFWAGYPYPLAYDSRTPPSGATGSQTGPIGGALGSYRFDFQSINDGTGCGFDQVSPVASKVINVLRCEPKWSVDSNNRIATLAPPTPPNQVQVFLDPVSMVDAVAGLEAALSDLNGRVSTTGISFQRVTVWCGDGPGCITVQIVPLGTGCGYTPPFTTDSSGHLLGPLYLHLNTTWPTWSQASLQRTFAHELGHRLGLADYDVTSACDITGNSAIMQPNFTCGPTAAPTTAATMNDYLPINSTVYGGNPRVTCGF